MYLYTLRVAKKLSVKPFRKFIQNFEFDNDNVDTLFSGNIHINWNFFWENKCSIGSSLLFFHSYIENAVSLGIFCPLSFSFYFLSYAFLQTSLIACSKCSIFNLLFQLLVICVFQSLSQICKSSMGDDSSQDKASAPPSAAAAGAAPAGNPQQQPASAIRNKVDVPPG